MKLTLEHLAPYLPYSLEAMVKCDGQEYKASVTGFYHFGTELHIECKNGLPGLYRFNTEEEYVKPILRPLSDLTSRFEFHFIWENETDIKSIENLYGIDNESLLMNKFSYEFWSLCFENHIDVFGLIEKGLAINMNDL